MNRSALVVAFTLIAASASAQQPAPQPSSTATAETEMRLTLMDAEQRALDRNPAIASARLGAQAASYTVAESRAAYSPSFSATLAQRSQTTPSTTQLSGGQSQVTTDALTFGSGISQALPWGGGSLSLDFSGNRNASSNIFSTYNPSYASGVTMSLTQPLFRGFRFDPTRAEIEQAEITSDIADVGLRAEMASTLASVRHAYWELVYAADALDTARQSEALAQRQFDDNRQRAQIGTIAAVDVLESEAEVASRHQAVVQAEGSWRTAQVALKQLMAANATDAVWTVSLVPVDRPAEGTRTIDVPTAIAAALANRSDLATARKERDSSATTVKLLADQRKPTVNLIADYSLNGIGGTQILRQTGALGSEIIGTTPGGYLDVLRSIGQLDYPTWNVGLNITVPLGRKAADAAYARGQVQQRQREVGIQTLELAVAAQVRRIAETVRSAEEQIRAASVATSLALKRLSAEEARRAAGLSTNFLVLQAQRDLATAQTTQLRALLDYRKALVDFDLVQQAPA